MLIKFVFTFQWQAEFFHYPKQQNCIVDLLEQMEENGLSYCIYLYYMYVPSLLIAIIFVD